MSVCRHLEANATSKHSISLATHPLPQVGLELICHNNENDNTDHHHHWLQARTRSFETVAGNGVDMINYAFGITLPLGLAILVSSFPIFPLRYLIMITCDKEKRMKTTPISERATSAKQVQIMTGLHPATFWASNLLWDLLLFLLSSTPLTPATPRSIIASSQSLPS